MGFLSFLIYMLALSAAIAAVVPIQKLTKTFRFQFLSSYLGFLVALNSVGIMNLIVNDLTRDVLKNVPAHTITTVYILFGLIAFPLLALAFYLFLDFIAGLLDKKFPFAARVAYGILWAGLLAVFLMRIQFALREKIFPLLQALNLVSGIIILLIPLAALAYLISRAGRLGPARQGRRLLVFAVVSLASLFLYLTSFFIIPAGSLSRLTVPLLLLAANVLPVLVLKRYLATSCPPIGSRIFDVPLAARFQEEHQISNREADILALLLQGKSNKQIETQLFISPHTVRNHIYNLYQKLGISSRLQLMNLVRTWIESVSSS